MLADFPDRIAWRVLSDGLGGQQCSVKIEGYDKLLINSHLELAYLRF